MKHLRLLLLLSLFLGGCSTPAEEAPAGPTTRETAKPKDEAQERFETTLATGSNGEIDEAAKAYFVVGGTERTFASVLDKAQKVESEGDLVTYRLWIRGKNPDIEGDGWVQVEVAGKPPSVRSVRTVVLKK